MAAINNGPTSAPAVPAADTATPAAPSGPVWDALTANPGATVAKLAAAAGIDRDHVRKDLLRFEKDGLASRTARKGRNGDTWTSTPPAPAPAVGTDAPPAAPADPPADPPADVSPDATGTGTVVNAETLKQAMEVMTQEAERRAAAEEELAVRRAEEEARRAKIEAELTRARAVESTRQALTDLLGAVTAAYASLVEGDEASAAARMTYVHQCADNLRRVTRTPARSGGTRTGGNGGGPTQKAAPRPLRPEVIAHLRAHPGTDFTPGEIGRKLDRSPGAVVNALNKLVELGEAVLTNEHPARFRLAPTTAPDPTSSDNGSEGTGDDAPVTPTGSTVSPAAAPATGTAAPGAGADG